MENLSYFTGFVANGDIGNGRGGPVHGGITDHSNWFIQIKYLGCSII